MTPSALSAKLAFLLECQAFYKTRAFTTEVNEWLEWVANRLIELKKP